MLAMQYNISLPSEYDMGIIKNRVRDNGSKTDGFPGLKMKAYLVAEKAKYENSENRYAPFYLWEKEEGMNKFLLGGPFNNILNSFGRPVVHCWVVLHEWVRKVQTPQYAVVQTAPIAASRDFTALCEREGENFAAWTREPSTTGYIVAYNPGTWELCRFHMTTDPEKARGDAADRLVYDIHHVS